jgi:hypothetical protein
VSVTVNSVDCRPLTHFFFIFPLHSQGAFNSWDRMPFVTTVRDGVTPSSIPADNLFHHSFVVANYAGAWLPHIPFPTCRCSPLIHAHHTQQPTVAAWTMMMALRGE